MADAGVKLTAQEKVAKARAAYDAINRGEAGGDFTDDAVWHSMLSGEVKGVAAIRAAQQKQREMFDTFRLDVHDVLASDDHVVALTTLKTSKAGESSESRLILVAHVTDYGKVKELWSFPERK
jgi:ketosteroid isomerase-like protein